MLIRCIRALAVTSLVASLLLCGLNHNHVNDNDNNENDPQPSQLRRHLSAWLDPKTVVGKSLGSMSHHSNVNHGLDPSLRIVAFGTSKTWGAGLDHPENETYVALLSPTALNLGLRSTPADYPSLCLHSMIGTEQVFDVIILEYSPFRGAPHRDFERLAHRLRARFPHAIMIYLPIYMLLHDVSYQKQGLQGYLQQSLGMESPKGPHFAQTIRSLEEKDLQFPCESYNMDLYRKTLHDIQGHMVEFPDFQPPSVKNFILDNAQYYTSARRPWDFVHPSVLGHQVIAHKLRQRIKHALAITSRDRQQQQQQLDDSSLLGEWLGGKDRCVSWFSGGNVTDSVIRYANMDLVNFTPDGSDGKWALEVDRTGGRLSVECPFPHCNIYISYMAKGPEYDYPKVLMSMNNQKPLLVDPYIGKFHVRQIVHLGTIELPGMVTVFIKPIPEDRESPVRFRITGVITTPTAA